MRSSPACELPHMQALDRKRDPREAAHAPSYRWEVPPAGSGPTVKDDWKERGA